MKTRDNTFKIAGRLWRGTQTYRFWRSASTWKKALLRVWTTGHKLRGNDRRCSGDVKTSMHTLPLCSLFSAFVHSPLFLSSASLFPRGLMIFTVEFLFLSFLCMYYRVWFVIPMRITDVCVRFTDVCVCVCVLWFPWGSCTRTYTYVLSSESLKFKLILKALHVYTPCWCFDVLLYLFHFRYPLPTHCTCSWFYYLCLWTLIPAF